MLLRYLGLPFFIFQLGWVVLPTTLVLLWSKLSRYQPLLLALVLLLITLGVSLTQLSSPPPIQPLSPLEQTQHYFEQLLKEQPTHRDLLLNLSRVYTVLGDEEQAQHYYDQAKELDPNNPLFTQENK